MARLGTRLGVVVLLLAPLLLVGVAIAGAVSPPGGGASYDVGRSPTRAAADGPERVTVGFYADNLQGLDQQDNSYYADFFIWLRWDGPLNPNATLEFTNNVERWGLTTAKVYDQAKRLPSGELIQQYRVQGKFFQPLDLSDYPLDSHELTLVVEDTTYSEDQLVYVADTEESGIDASARIPGWQITGTDLAIDSHFYDTNFGEPESEASQRTYSAARFAITIKRPLTFFLWKLLLPLVIVMSLAGSVLFVHPSLIEVRLAAPATALLSLVFLQQSYTSTLPELGTLILLDKIYVLAYSLIIVMMLATIVTSYWSRVGDDVLHARAARLDHVAAVGSAIVFAGGTALFILLR
jgi:hypothetical protein